jgi:hypothetical protein
MTFEELRTALRQRPFKPFRLYVSEGETFDIHHPELCMAGYTSAIVGFPSPEDVESDVYKRYTVIDLAHVIRLEPLDMPAKKGA